VQRREPIHGTTAVPEDLREAAPSARQALTQDWTPALQPGPRSSDRAQLVDLPVLSTALWTGLAGGRSLSVLCLHRGRMPSDERGLTLTLSALHAYTFGSSPGFMHPTCTREGQGVCQMATQKVRPDLDSWNDQERRQQRSTRNRKIGAFAVVAALLAGVAIVAINLQGDEPTTDVGTDPDVEASSGLYHLNLTTGATTPLPGSLPEAALYAVSPDGSMIAGAPCCSPPNHVWVANIDGTEVR
jgi:hypothetical protein